MLTTRSLLLLTYVTSMMFALPVDTSPVSNRTHPADCPLYLPTKNFEFPHLIVPISYASPDSSLGNTFTPSIAPNDLATIFNFDIPASRAGQTCSLYFGFPTQDQLVTTNYTFWGPGTFQLVRYKANTGATPKTTWRTQPQLDSSPPVTLDKVSPGHAYKLWTGSCGAGGVISWRMSSVDSCLWYFQDFNDCAIGLYIVYG